MKRLALVFLVLALLGPSTGCGVLEAVVYHPLHPAGYGAACCDAPCEVACGPACGSACGPPCETACEPACGPACGPCGDVSCGPCCRPFPLLYALFHPLTWCCGGGCGEMYWGGWASDPPDCCDPCDDWGNFIGGGCAGGHCGGGCASGTCGGGSMMGGFAGGSVAGIRTTPIDYRYVKRSPAAQGALVGYQTVKPTQTAVKR